MARSLYAWLFVPVFALSGCAAGEREPLYPQPVPGESLPVSEAPAANGAGGAARAAGRPGQNGDVWIGEDEESAVVDADPRALTDFHDELKAHGTWTEDDRYGTVWVPSATEVGDDFVPYQTAGHWTYSDDYVWVSDYSWGWIPFHYGRWAYVPGRRWVWIPGRTYAGAWVTWRYGGPGYGYVGWAPLGPSWYWYNGVAVAYYGSPYVWGWSYCASADLYHPAVATRVVRGPAYVEVAEKTRPYVPARPSVGRTPARPSVAGDGARVAASPTTPGTERAAAAPVVGGVAAYANAAPSVTPRPMGPTPEELGLDRTSVVHTPPGTTSVERARAASHVERMEHRGGSSPPALGERLAGSTLVQPHGGPSLGRAPISPRVSRLDPVATAPRYQTSDPAFAGMGTRVPASAGGRPATILPPRTWSPSPYASQGRAAQLPSYGSRPSLSGGSTFDRYSVSPSAQPQPRFTTPRVEPSYRPQPRFSTAPSTPSFRSQPSYTQPSMPSFRSSPSFSSGSSFRSQPSYSRPSAPSFRSSPSFSSGSSFRSQPSYSRPSAPSFRSSPSFSRPSFSGGSFRSAPSNSGIRSFRRR